MNGRCLVWLPDERRVFAGLEQSAEDKDEVITLAARSALGSRLSLSIDGGKTLREVIADLAFTQGRPWPGVYANRRGIKEVWIGGKLWARKVVPAPPPGELVDPTDDFNRTNEDPIVGNWTTGFSGWFSLRLVSNTLGGPSAGDNDGAAYLYHGALTTPRTINVDDSLEFAAGAIDVAET